jgi:hypothetical protein
MKIEVKNALVPLETTRREPGSSLRAKELYEGRHVNIRNVGSGKNGRIKIEA